MHIHQEVTMPMLHGNAPKMYTNLPTSGRGPVNRSYLREAMLQKRQQNEKKLNDFKDRNY